MADHDEITSCRRSRTTRPRWRIDPLEPGASGGVTTLTDRELLRIVLVATEVGARFQRDGLSHDPLAWMVAPRRLFHGRPAIEACSNLEACTQAILLHGLGFGLDVDAGTMRALLDDEEVRGAAVALDVHA